MRVLWVYESMNVQLQALALSVARQSDIDLEIMTRHVDRLPPELSHIPVTRIECRNKVDFRARREIRHCVKKGQYDVVHAYTSRNFANLLAACRGLRPLPKLIGYRGVIDRLHVLDPANWITHWHSRASAVTCVCHATKRAMQASGIPAAKLATVWEGCLPETLQTPPRSTLREFGIPTDAFVIGTVANIRPVKGVDLMLRAAAELATRRDIYWLVIGDKRDPLVTKLAADRRISNCVKLPGARKHGGKYSGLFDIYVAPSRKEGLSMGIMEAMAQSVCPVVTDVGGNCELIRNNIDGIVIPPEDHQALCRAVDELIDDPSKRTRLAQSAHERLLHEFSINAWADRLCEVYRRFATTGISSAA